MGNPTHATIFGALRPSTFAAVAGRRVRFVPLSAAPPLAVGYVVRATRPNEILETFIHALHSITRKA
jgi:hypothetical protein